MLESFNNMDSSEWGLIDVIANSGACATVMLKHNCGNARPRESAGSKSGFEYDVESGKAVPNLGEPHCEVFRGQRVVDDDALPGGLLIPARFLLGGDDAGRRQSGSHKTKYQ